MTCSVDAYRVVVGQFHAILCKILTRKALIAAKRIRGLRVRGVADFFSVTTLLAMLVIGGVELNPGPGSLTDNSASMDRQPSSDTGSDSNNSDNFTRLHTALAGVTAAIGRLETGQASFSKSQASLSSQLTDVKSKLDRKLAQIEQKQEEQGSRMNELSAECERLHAENSCLRSSVNCLEEKVDVLENHSRRNNLLFFGIEQRPNESWEDCEETLHDIIYDKMGVRSEVFIERAHRVGKAVIAKFLSFKDKTKVLSHAKFLKGSSISVREDVSLAVREKQKHLVPLMKDLREKKNKAKLRHDKLVTSKGVFTYDLKTKEVVKLQPNRKAHSIVSTAFQRSATRSAPMASHTKMTVPRIGNNQQLPTDSHRNNDAIDFQAENRHEEKDDGRNDDASSVGSDRSRDMDEAEQQQAIDDQYDDWGIYVGSQDTDHRQQEPQFDDPQPDDSPCMLPPLDNASTAGATPNGDKHEQLGSSQLHREAVRSRTDSDQHTARVAVSPSTSGNQSPVESSCPPGSGQRPEQVDYNNDTPVTTQLPQREKTSSQQANRLKTVPGSALYSDAAKMPPSSSKTSRPGQCAPSPRDIQGGRGRGHRRGNRDNIGSNSPRGGAYRDHVGNQGNASSDKGGDQARTRSTSRNPPWYSQEDRYCSGHHYQTSC